MKYAYIVVIGILLGIVSFGWVPTLIHDSEDETLGTELRVLRPGQGGTGTSTAPSIGQVLIGLSDGTYAPRATSSLNIAAAGDGVSNWLSNGTRLTPSTTLGIVVFASSTIGGGTDSSGLTISGNGTTTGNIFVQGTGTSTIGGALVLGLNRHLVAHGAVADGSDGFHIDANNGTQVANFGAGGSAGATFYDGVTVTGLLAANGTFSTPFGTSTTFYAGTTTLTSATATNFFATNLSALNATITDATTTNLAATTRFTLISDLITNVATWIDAKVEALTNVVLQGVWDFGGATSVEVPNGTGPTVDTAGEIGIDTTANQLLFATSSSDVAVIPPVQYSRFTYASSTWTGTTTLRWGGPALQPLSFQAIDCVTDGGTAKILAGSGLASTSVVAVTTATGTDAFAISFTAGQVPRFNIGTPSTVAAVSCTLQYVYTRQ